MQTPSTLKDWVITKTRKQGIKSTTKLALSDLKKQYYFFVLKKPFENNHNYTDKKCDIVKKMRHGC